MMTDDNPNTQAQTMLKNLSQLIGTWDVTLAFPTDPPGTVNERVVFDWLEGGAFVIQHLGSSVWIIGPDESTETYSMLYHDARSVSRVYQMSLHKGIWKVWRNAPGFSQRFEGKFSEDGKTITARWENSGDSSTWEHDFDLTYTKLS